MSDVAATGPRWHGRRLPILQTARQVIGAVRRTYLTLHRERVPQLAALATAWLVVCATGVYLAERLAGSLAFDSPGEAVWYGIVTMTTVGYGDFVPKTAVGRAIAVALMLGGFGLLSLITATLASIMVARKIQEGRGLETVKLKNHVLVCGWNQYAERVLDGLVDVPGAAVSIVLVSELAEDAANEILLRYRDHEVRFVRGDPAMEATLDRANVREARAAVVLADASHGFGSASDERTTLVTLALNSIRPGIKVTAEALDLRSEAHLRRAGAADIVISGEFNGFLLSSATTAPGIAQVVRRLLSLDGPRLRREAVPPEFVGRTFGELSQALQTNSGFLTLAVVTESKGFTLDDLLTDDYSLVDTFIKQQFNEAGTEYLRFEEGATRVRVNPPASLPIGADDTVIGIPREL